METPHFYDDLLQNGKITPFKSKENGIVLKVGTGFLCPA